MALWDYFLAFGEQNRRLREESGTPTAICGIFKAPFDILADKLRGYIGLTMDMMTQPDKVLKACEALMPHLYNVAVTSADPNRRLPIGFWMHRGCKPFVSEGQFESHYWPTVKPIIEELWRNGHQTLFYAEGDWKHHLQSFTELPEKSIVYHVDRGDILEVAKVLGDKFCLSGGIPNFLLSHGKFDDLRAHLKKVIDHVARNGGYIVDASAIMQNDTDAERLTAMTDFVRDYGVYSTGHAARQTLLPEKDLTVSPPLDMNFGENYGMSEQPAEKVKAGVCIPWEEKAKELPKIVGDERLTKRIWEEIEGFGNLFVWHCLLSF
jgi:uroporphyrinogen-III decarboxylase